MEELKQWVTAFWKGGVAMSEDYAGLYRPSHSSAPSTVGGGGSKSTVISGNKTTVIGTQSKSVVNSAYSTN